MIAQKGFLPHTAVNAIFTFHFAVAVYNVAVGQHIMKKKSKSRAATINTLVARIPRIDPTTLQTLPRSHY